MYQTITAHTTHTAHKTKNVIMIPPMMEPTIIPISVIIMSYESRHILIKIKVVSPSLLSSDGNVGGTIGI